MATPLSKKGYMNSFYQFVENRIKNYPADRLLSNAWKSLNNYSPEVSSENELTSDILLKWIIGMKASGSNPSTYRRYLGKLHTLFKEWRVAGSRDPFNEIKTLLEKKDNAENSNLLKNLHTLLKVIKQFGGANGSQLFNILLYLLINIDATLEDIIAMQFSDEQPDISQLQDVVDRMQSTGARKKYVFGLNQGKERVPAIAIKLNVELLSLLKGYGIINNYNFIENKTHTAIEIIHALWIAAALEVGVSAEEIANIFLNLPEQYKYLQLLPKHELPEERKLAIMHRVADYINDKTTRWFVMHLRTGNSPEDIKEGIKNKINPLLKEIQFYYPTHTVVTYDKKRRKIRKEEPYLPRLLFFRMRRDKVGRLFSKIGDLAWCYRFTSDPSSPYCVISNKEMKRFQYHIGNFTPDIQIQLIERKDAIEKGTEVKISGGGKMEGYVGVITDVRNADGTRTYSLRLSDNAFATWQISDIPELYLQPV